MRSLPPCKECGGKLRRSRRNLIERFFYAEAYRCSGCGARGVGASLYNLKHAQYVKCPRCHSVDLTVLKRRDGIDRMYSGILNTLQKLAGGKLYHCWFCRLQFYDVRPRFHTDDTPTPANPTPDQDVKVTS